jgi:hypothetical protein
MNAAVDDMPQNAAERVFAYWPQLRDAKQPAPIPFPKGRTSSRFNVGEEWAQVVQQMERGEWRLREPVANPAGLVGPLRGVGNCLAPLLPGGEYQWIDPTCEPMDGDLVLVEWGPQTLAKLIERNRHNEDWVRTYGINPGPIATKLLKKSGLNWWLVTRESMMPLGPHSYLAPDGSRVCGVVRYLERDGAPIYGCGPMAVSHNINPEAATSVTSTSDAGPITISCPGSQVFEDVLYIEIDVDDNDIVEVAAHYRMGVTGNPGFTVEHYAASWNTSGGAEVGSEHLHRDDNLYQGFGIVGTFTRGAGTWRFGIGCTVTRGAATGTLEAIFRDIELQVTRVKR